MSTGTDTTQNPVKDSPRIIATVGNLLRKKGQQAEFRVLSEGRCDVEVVGYDNWDGGTDVYGLSCMIPLELYAEVESEIEQIQRNIQIQAEPIFKRYERTWLGPVTITPLLSDEMHGRIYKTAVSDLLEALGRLKSQLIAVSTGGPKIASVNPEYQRDYALVVEALGERGISSAIPFKDLWAWYGKWSDGTLPTYQSRREYIGRLFDPIETQVSKADSAQGPRIFEQPTGWARIDRSMGEIKQQLFKATTEEQFQAIGLLSRETLISLAQHVFDPIQHKSLDGVEPSDTDAKRMLEAYLTHVLEGSSNATIRKHARASLELANELTHKRTAIFRDAALCAEATNAAVNIIAIISGRRDGSVR